jgi:hypothetical protein
MSLQADLYNQFDPARPLEAGEATYVDWQKELGADDVKKRLARSFALSGVIPVCRLFTGHRGVGKTTELKRVKEMLEQGLDGRRFFVSLLEAEQWMDLSDVRPPDVVLHIVRQLVEDFKKAEVPLGDDPLSRFFGELKDLMGRSVELKELSVPVSWVQLGLTLKEVPHARATLRSLLEGRLPTLYHLINEDILRKAKKHLGQPENGGYQDVVVMVDELDRIPQKVLNEQGLTNHENLFLDHAAVLRFLSCDVLYTIPIELAYSTCRARLTMTYSSEILTLPVIPVSRRDGKDRDEAMSALRRVVEARVEKAGATPELVFDHPDLLTLLCRLSGGHVRNLFVLLRSALERADQLPLTQPVIDQAVRRQAIDLSLALSRKQWTALDQVHRTKQPVEDVNGLWYQLLKDLFVLAYEDDKGAWYDWNPLLGEVPRSP